MRLAVFKLYYSIIQTPEEWQFVFFVTALVYFGGAIFYGITASGERQEWSKMENYEESRVILSKFQEQILQANKSLCLGYLTLYV